MNATFQFGQARADTRQFNPPSGGGWENAVHNSNIPGQFRSVYNVALNAVVSIANRQADSNAGRMYLYNNLASNNGANSTLSAVAEYAVRLSVVYKLQGRFNDYNRALESAVNDTLARACSEAVALTPELQQTLPQNVVQAMATLLQNTEQVRAAVLQVDLNQGLGAVSHQPSQMQMVQTQGVNSNLSVNTASDDFSVYGYELPLPSPREQLEEASRDQEVEDVESKVEAQQVPVEPAKPVINRLWTPGYKPSKTIPDRIVSIKGVREMDRNTHTAPYSELFGEVPEGLDQVTHSTLEAISAAEAVAIARSAHGVETMLSEVMATPGHETMTHEDTSRMMVMLANQAREAGRDVGVCRGLFYELNPYFLPERLFKMFNSVRKTTLPGLGKWYTDMYKNVPMSNDQYSLANLVSHIDTVYGYATNAFLGRDLGLRATMSTFSDSFQDAAEYLMQLPEPFYDESFRSFCSTMDRNFRVVDERIYGSQGIVQETPIGTAYGVLSPIVVSCTYIDISDRYLGLQARHLGSDIDPLVTPTLHRLCDSLFKIKLKHEWETSFDYLITADCVEYVICRKLGTTDRYRLYRTTGIGPNFLA